MTGQQAPAAARPVSPQPGGWLLVLAALLIAATAVIGCSGGATSSPPRFPALMACAKPRNLFACVVREHRPIGGKPVVVDHGPAHWTLLAWAYAIPHHGDGWCWATFQGPRWDGASCGGGIQQLPVFFPGRGFSKMINAYAEPGTVIRIKGGADLWAMPSLVTAPAARVVVVYRGRSYAAPVARVPLGPGRWVGAFQVWLRLPPRSNGWTGSQISGEIAYDGLGRVIARHGPWPP